jgi:hypothetical protein
MPQRNKKHLRPDGKLRKGYRYGSGGEVIKSKAKVCKEKASKKIGLTMKEFKKGNEQIKSPKQAIAVGFKMTIKENPQCKRELRKR